MKRQTTAHGRHCGRWSENVIPLKFEKEQAFFEARLSISRCHGGGHPSLIRRKCAKGVTGDICAERGCVCLVFPAFREANLCDSLARVVPGAFGP